VLRSARDGSEHDESAEYVVRCECGYEVRGPIGTIVPALQDHGHEAHNMQVTREKVLAMAQPA